MASTQPIHSPHLRLVPLHRRRHPTTTATFTTNSYGCRRILTISCRLNASTPSNTDSGEDLLSNDPSLSDHGGGFPVFVSLPVDAVGPGSSQVRRRKAMVQSFKALAASGVEGIVMEVWWGLVERDMPQVYDWQGYWDITEMARLCRLKVRVVLGFHQCGAGPEDPHWIALPLWVLEEMNKNPNLAYSDRYGRRSIDYISLGCDILPVLRGRSPIQAYADFMRNFRDAFSPFFGDVISGIQIGMGPGGELTYPLLPSQVLTRISNEPVEFQCYDKYMLATLNACACENGIPGGAEVFKSDVGSWNDEYREFFLKWYYGNLIFHGERICREAETVFRGVEVCMLAKLFAFPYATDSPPELTSGYLNAPSTVNFPRIARLLGRYGFGLCCTWIDLLDVEGMQKNAGEAIFRQLVSTARLCNVPLEGQSIVTDFQEGSFERVHRMSKYCSDGSGNHLVSFNFVRMDKRMFEYGNWVRFTRFVRQMSVASIFQARLGAAHILTSSVGSCESGIRFCLLLRVNYSFTFQH